MPEQYPPSKPSEKTSPGFTMRKKISDPFKRLISNDTNQILLVIISLICVGFFYVMKRETDMNEPDLNSMNQHTQNTSNDIILSIPSHGTLRIVAFGDSTTALREGVQQVYCQRLTQALHEIGLKVEMFNAGIPGNNTDQARQRFADDVLSHNPHLVIIQFGINDAAVDVWKDPPATEPRVPLERYVSNLRHFISTLQDRHAQVILMTPNPMRWTPQIRDMYGKPPYDPHDPDGINIILLQYARHLPNIAEEFAVPLIDVYQAYQAYPYPPDRQLADLYLDSQHPNDAGHALVASLLFDIIKQASEN